MRRMPIRLTLVSALGALCAIAAAPASADPPWGRGWDKGRGGWERGWDRPGRGHGHRHGHGGHWVHPQFGPSYWVARPHYAPPPIIVVPPPRHYAPPPVVVYPPHPGAWRGGQWHDRPGGSFYFGGQIPLR